MPGFLKDGRFWGGVVVGYSGLRTGSLMDLFRPCVMVGDRGDSPGRLVDLV